MKSQRCKRPARLCAIALLLILTACANPSLTIGPGTLTGPIKAKPVTVNGKPPACSEFSLIRPNRGKPGGASILDVQGALVQEDGLGRARNYLGDTSGTLAQVDEHNAAWHALCDDPQP